MVKKQGVQVRTELKPLRIGEENDFALAIQSHKIIDGERELLMQAVRYSMLKVGIRAANIPSGEEKEILIAHIVKNYGNHTPDEIKLAFDMAINGKLRNAKGETTDPNCFENFSCQYFSRIMNDYRTWSAQTMEQFTRNDQPAEKGFDYSWRGIIQQSIDDLNNGGKSNYRIYSSDMYDQLVMDGFINLSAYEAFVELSKNTLCNEVHLKIVQSKKGSDDAEVDIGKYKNIQALENQLIDLRSGRMDRDINTLAKQMCIRHYFQYLKGVGINKIYEPV